jgi:hypothetical protein
MPDILTLLQTFNINLHGLSASNNDAIGLAVNTGSNTAQPALAAGRQQRGLPSRARRVSPRAKVLMARKSQVNSESKVPEPLGHFSLFYATTEESSTL